MSTTAEEQELRRLLSKMIRAERETRNASYQELAEEIGVSDVTIFNWEHEKALPRRDSWTKIAKYFKLTAMPFEEFIQGIPGSARRLKEDRLRNLLAQCLPEERDQLLDMFEAMVVTRLKRRES